MGVRVAWAVGFAVVVALGLWLLLRGPGTEATSKAVDRGAGDAPDAALHGRAVPKSTTPADGGPAPESAAPTREPYFAIMIDDSVPVVRVSGHLLMGGSDEPVEGATVAAWTVELRQRTCEYATTDEGGRFVLERVAVRQPVWIVARAPGWHAVATPVFLRADEDDFVIHVGVGGTLEGRVTQPDGRPADGMEVWLVRPGLSLPDLGIGGPYFDELRYFAVPRVKTDLSGAYAFRGVPLGAERLPAVRLSAIAEATGDPVRFSQAGEILQDDIRIPELATLTVTVLDAAGNVLTDDSMSFETERIQFRASTPGQPGRRLPDGSFRVEGMTPGTWTVRGHIPGAGWPERKIVLRPGADEAIEIRPPDGAVLEGQVVDSDGEPVAWASITFHGPTYRSASADEEGRFRFIGLPLAPGTLEIEEGGPPPLTLEQILEGTIPVPRDRLLSPVTIEDVRAGGDPVRIVLPYGGRIRGSFVGVESGTELRGLLLTPKSAGGMSFRASPEGSFHRDAPPVGMPFLMKFTTPDGRYWMREFDPLRAGEDLDLGEIVFEEGTDLDGHVLAPGGGPVENAKVALTQRWTDQETWTDADGAFHFTQVPRRPVYVRVDARGHPPAFRALDARTGGIQDITLSRGGILELRVLDADGNLVTEGSFTIWWELERRYGADMDGLFDWFRLDPSGTTRLRCEAATYRVGIWHPSNEQSAWIHPEIREGETTRLEVRLERNP